MNPVLLPRKHLPTGTFLQVFRLREKDGTLLSLIRQILDLLSEVVLGRPTQMSDLLPEVGLAGPTMGLDLEDGRP